AVCNFVSIASVWLHQPQINIPCAQTALNIRNVFSIRRPDRHTNRNFRVPFEGELPTVLSVEVQHPKIAMAATVTQIYEFMIPGRYRWCLYRAGLVRDLDTPSNIFYRTAADWVAPNIELNLPTGRNSVAVTVQIRRDVRSLAEGEP